MKFWTRTSLFFSTLIFLSACGQGPSGSVQQASVERGALLQSLTGPGAPSIPSTLFGMHYQGYYPTVSYGILGKGSGVIWPYVEPSRGVWNWSALDNYVSAAQSHGLPMIYTFEGVPAWAIAGSSTATCGTLYTGALTCNQPPDDMADWTTYVTTLVARYCPAGLPKIQYYELWNEPYDVAGTNNVQLSPINLAKMTHAAYGIIRSQCPAAKIITPSMAMVTGTTGWYAGYAQAYFNSLGPVGTDPVDIASVHSYIDNPEGILSTTSITVINTYAAGKPVWDTEGAWSTNTMTDDWKAAFLARWYLLHWSAGYSSMEWYQWENSSWGTLCFGGYPACTPNAITTTAYTQTYNWMVGATMTTPCSVDSNSTYTCGLTRQGGYQALAIWNTGGSRSYTPPTQYTKFRDLAGNTITFSGSITIGVKPILLEGTGAVSSPTPTPTPLPSPSPSPVPSPNPSPSSPPMPSPTPVPTPVPIPSPTIDTQAPITSITSPVNGSTVPVRTTQVIKASATDNVGVTKLEVYVNGALKCSSSFVGSPKSVSSSCNFSVGRKLRAYNLQTKAYDAAGNIGSSSTVTVTSK